MHFEKLSRRDFTFYYIHFSFGSAGKKKNFNLDIGTFFNGKSFMLNTWQTARPAAARFTQPGKHHELTIHKCQDFSGRYESQRYSV